MGIVTHIYGEIGDGLFLFCQQPIGCVPVVIVVPQKLEMLTVDRGSQWLTMVYNDIMEYQNIYDHIQPNRLSIYIYYTYIQGYLGPVWKWTFAPHMVFLLMGNVEIHQWICCENCTSPHVLNRHKWWSVRVAIPKCPKNEGLVNSSILWLCQNSCWKWPFIVDFPVKKCDFP